MGPEELGPENEEGGVGELVTPKIVNSVRMCESK